MTPTQVVADVKRQLKGLHALGYEPMRVEFQAGPSKLYIKLRKRSR